MTVQRTDGIIQMTPGKDFIRTDKGITWGIKVRDMSTFAVVVFIVVQNPDGTWSISQTIDEAVDLNINNYPTVKDYLKTLISKIQAWLTKTFGSNTVPPVTPKGDKFDELDALIVSSLKITTNADGSLTVSLV